MEIEAWRQRFVDYLHEYWETDDGAHDIHHLHRVWRTCRKLNDAEGMPADMPVLLAACYFHDFVTLPKNDPDRRKASLLSADAASRVLAELAFPEDKIAAVHHAIHAHSFSAQVSVQSAEAAILQDADRMEALGAIGQARLFYTAGKMGSLLFDPQDSLAESRPLNDVQFALDHIEAKLLKLSNIMQTGAGRQMAERETDYLLKFRAKMAEEAAED